MTSDAARAEIAPGRRRRGRTTLLIAAALVLGTLAGTVTGYAIQYHREPTPLPPLALRQVNTPKPLAADGATTLKSINANRWHKTDGDLTELLLEPPPGAKVEESPGYESLDFFAADHDNPEEALRDFVTGGLRRIALTSWSTNDRYHVTVRLIQFRDREGADEYQQGYSAGMPSARRAGNPGVSIPGVPDDLGHAWVDSKAQQEPGYEPYRSSRALVRRGDVLLEIFYDDNRGGNIAESNVVDLAKRQLERL
ncbi:hypothetical protein AB0D46_09095 [Streptomyces sp. NPDC048383]|uniref:hypothetical protein n=1 Tax=Streptomyces sp. NPDC048383 TaxID=3155386 RepID=UPI00343405ED